MSKSTPMFSGSGDMRPSLAWQLDSLCDQFEAAWIAGRQPQLEEYLQHVSQADQAELLKWLLDLEVTYRRNLGESPTPQDYLGRFGEHHEVVRAVFPNAGNQVNGPDTCDPRSNDNTATQLPRPPAAARPSIEGFEIHEELGRGGMGVVYKAHHAKLNRVVALKMILAGANAGPNDIARFQREAEAVARFQHPNIVQIHEVGEQGGLPFFALEFVSGGSLAQKIKSERVQPKESAMLVGTLARAIHVAHQRGIIHRDLKPGNILLTNDGTPKITDFGLAKRLESDAGLSNSGAITGTPSYMAPEQIFGKPCQVGAAADVYGLGAILYELLTGQPPFKEATPLETMLQVVSKDPPPVHKLCTGIPRDLAVISAKCLQKSIEDRYGNALELADDLQRFLDGKPISARPVGTLERIGKFARRRPALAATYGLLVLVAVLGATGTAMALLWQQAEAARQEAAKARDQLIAAEQKLSQISYLRAVDLAHREWHSGNIPRALELLNGCPERLRRWEWFYVNNLCRPRVPMFTGFAGAVGCVAFSADGRRLVCAGADGTVRLLDLHSRKEIRSFKGHVGWVHSVAFSADERKLASAGRDKKIRIWNPENGRQIAALEGHAKPIWSIAFSPDGQWLASASEDATVKIWDLSNGREAFTMEGHGRPIYTVAWHPNGLTLASGGLDGVVRIWNTGSGRQLNTLKGHADRIWSLAFSPDGQWLVSGSGDKTVKVWSVKMGAEATTLRGHKNWVMSVAVGPNNRTIASASWDQTIKVWDLSKGHLIATLRGHTGRISCVAFDRQGRKLASGSEDGAVKIWDPKRDQKSFKFKGQDGRVLSVAFSPDKRRLASASADATVTIWDLKSHQNRRTLKGHKGAVLSVAYGSDSKLLASGGVDKSVMIWSTGNGQLLQTLLGHGQAVQSVAFGPHSQMLASGSADATVKIWDVATGKEVRTLKGHSATVWSVSISPNGRQLASASADNTVRIWDLKTGQTHSVLKGHSGEVLGVALSPDGKRAASCGFNRLVKVWDLQSRRCVLSLKGHTRGIYGVAFSPGGDRLASASHDETIKIWDLNVGQESLTLTGHTGRVHAAAFSPDGRLLASGSWDSTVRIWDSRVRE